MRTRLAVFFNKPARALEDHHLALGRFSNPLMFRTERTHTRRDFPLAATKEASHEPASQSDILGKKVMRLEETRTVSNLLEEEQDGEAASLE